MRNVAKSFKTLTRLNDLQLDQLRLKISTLLNHQHQLNDKLHDLEVTADYERQWAALQIDKAQNLSVYIEKNAKDKKVIHSDLSETERQIEEIIAELQDRYQERKRYEIVVKRFQENEEKVETHQEQKFLDEIGLRKLGR